ncbi:MAG TPA: AMP-binding protein [Burkholderiales bacterium]|nr:AMP-binding protein [Burkholderiales bacterium]
MITIPLVRGFSPGAVFAYGEGQAVGVEAFLRDARELAARLPERRHVLNVCNDRYHFAVGFAAGLLRRQVSLLPPNLTPDLLERLIAQFPDVYCLTDKSPGIASLETVSFSQAPGSGPPVTVVPVVPESQVAVIVFTSGSTGEPVAYRKTWGSLARSARAEIERLDLHARPGMAVLGTVPPQHSYGLESTVLMVMQGGLALHARRPLLPADIRAELAALPRPRALVTTPVHLRALLAEADGLPPADLLLCATAPLSPQLAAQAEAGLAAPLHEIYGCTEAGQVASRRTVATNEWRALRGIRMRADDNGTWVKGGHVETEVLLADVIELRGHTRFLLHGRTADLVNIAGKRTSLAHLNYHLNSIAGVRDGVFVVPEESGGAVARLTAYVVAPGLTSEALLLALRQRIDAAFLPRPLHFVEALPRNETGKLPQLALSQITAGLGTGREPSRP